MIKGVSNTLIEVISDEEYDRLLNSLKFSFSNREAISYFYNDVYYYGCRKENVIKTAFHEVFHVLQHACIVEADLGMDHGIFTKEELEQMKHEFLDENYSMEQGKYENLLIEVQAESFAYALYEQVKDKL